MAVLALAVVPAGSGQEVGAVDGLDGVLDLHAHDQDHVGQAAEDALEAGGQGQASRGAGSFNPQGRLVLQAGIHDGHEGAQVALAVEPGGHEVADDAFVDDGGIADLGQGCAPGFPDVVGEARPDPLGAEFGPAGAQAHGIGAGGEVDGLGHALHGGNLSPGSR